MGHATTGCDAAECVRFRNLPSPIGSVEWTQWSGLSGVDSVEWTQWDEQLGSNHIARTIWEALKQLDLRALRRSYFGSGSCPDAPELMLAMVLVEKYAGNWSPRAWHRDQFEKIALMWIGQGIRPARGLWSQFRDRIGPFLDQWHSQIIQIALEANITSATRGVVDGTLIAASASRHR